jgi:hypothetical protein
MDTFPYDTWTEAFEGANANGDGYFTWGPGGNTASYILAALGIALFLYYMVVFTMREDQHQQAAVARLADKYKD